MLARRTDWEKQLAAYLACVKPGFVLGTRDCAHFVAGAVDAMCGTYLSRIGFGEYSNDDEARAQLRSHDAESLLALAERLLETCALPEGRTLYARCGDAIYFPPAKWQADASEFGLLGIVFDDVHSLTRRGIVRVTLRFAHKAAARVLPVGA